MFEVNPNDYINVDGSHLMSDGGGSFGGGQGSGGFDIMSLLGSFGGSQGGQGQDSFGQIAGMIQGLLNSGSLGGQASGNGAPPSMVPQAPMSPSAPSVQVRSSIPVPFQHADFTPFVRRV